MQVILLLLALLGLAFGQNHIDTTAVTLAEAINSDGEHFLVSIDHIEDEISVDGKILAERRVHVGLQFDVVESNNVLVNGVPAPIGYSELKVQAALFEVDEAGKPSPFDQIVSITIRIFVGYRLQQMEDGSVASGIFIQERVVGIQEKEVWQAGVKEQLFVIRKDGTVTPMEVIEVDVLQGEVIPEVPKDEPQDGQTDDSQPPQGGKPHHGHHGHKHHGPHRPHGQNDPNNNNNNDGQQMDQPQSDDQQQSDNEQPEGKPHHGHQKCKLRKYWHKFLNWFNNLPFYLRLLFSFAVGLIFGFVGIAAIKCLCCTLCRSKKCQNKEENYKKNIHLYSLQYTAVPTDEKQAEKKEATETV